MFIFICMKYATHFDLEKYTIYKLFIKKCSNKTYEKNIVLHTHHIIPRHLWMDEKLSVNDKRNLIELSVDDHIQAHLLLAECYEDGTYQSISNLRSARLLNKKSIKDLNILDKISKSYNGINNPFFGKTHTDDVKNKLSKANDKLKGMTYDVRYGQTAEIEKRKRSESVKKYWDTIDIVEKNKRCQNISKSKKGKVSGSNNPFATKLLVNGNYYGSVKDACNALNTTPYYLYKNNNVQKLNK
jgi:hypothetical protein